MWSACCRHRNSLPVGTETVNRDGIVWVKIKDDIQRASEAYPNNWKKKSIIEWERFNNAVLPDGWWVVHLDGNKLNFDKENLYAVPKVVATSLKNVIAHNPHVINCGPEWAKTFLMASQLKADIEEKFGIIHNVGYSTGFKMVRKKLNNKRVYSVLDENFNPIAENIQYKEACAIASGKSS